MLKYALPALAVIGGASAACSVSATSTIQNAGDASALATCSTFTGSIAIATGTTDAINLAGVRTIRGSLIAEDIPRMAQLGADSLETITDTFKLNDVQILSELNFPRLTAVESIVWQGLPNLNALNFGSQVQEASNVDIQNTFLASLTGINVKVADTFLLANNLDLQQVSLQLANVTTSLGLVNNGKRLIAEFPNLVWAYNLTIRDTASIALPSLQTINGSLGFYENSFSSIAGPNLTDVGGSFSIVSNNQLTNVSFPKLTRIKGGFQVANNTAFEDVVGFEKLETIDGAFDVNGPIDNIEVPALNAVSGAFNLQSTEDITDICTNFKKLKDDAKIRGKYTCAGKQTTPGGVGTTPSGNTSDKSAASSMGMSALAFGASAVVAVMFSML